MKRVKIILILIFSIVIFSACSSSDENNIIAPPPAAESFLNGNWQGKKLQEQSSVYIDVDLKENVQIVTGSGTIRYVKTNDIVNIDDEIKGNITGSLIRSQISFTLFRASDSTKVTFSGGLSKTDSTIFEGNAIVNYKPENVNETFTLAILKQ